MDYTPYTIDSVIATLERTIRRLWILCIILIVALVGSNAGWIYYESQWEDVVVTQEGYADDGSDLKLQNIGGDYYGGEGKADD